MKKLSNSSQTSRCKPVFLKQEDIRIIITNEFFHGFTTLVEAVHIEWNDVELSVDTIRIRHL